VAHSRLLQLLRLHLCLKHRILLLLWWLLLLLLLLLLRALLWLWMLHCALRLLLVHTFGDQATDSVKISTKHRLCCQDAFLCNVGVRYVRELITHCSDLAKGHVKGFAFRKFC
jgi:hypothetical protein